MKIVPSWTSFVLHNQLELVNWWSKQGNLLRKLKTMSQYELVKMEKNERSVRLIVHAVSYRIMA